MIVSGSFKEDGSIDWGDGKVIDCFGQKGTGKSVMAKFVAATYPGDRIVIDVAGDDGPMGEGVIELRGDASTLPWSWPESERKDGEYMTVRYVPDPGSPTFLEDMDAVVGLALRHALDQFHKGRHGALLLVHEIGVVAPENKTQPNMMRALMHNRHNRLTMVMCGPRAMRINPLVRSQADIIYVFRLANLDDRKKLAEAIGWSATDFAEEVDAIKEQHAYLRIDLKEQSGDDAEFDHRLVHLPPLPADVVKEVMA